MNIHKFTNIPNNEDGKAFIRVLRKTIKGHGKQLRVRGRGYRHGNRRYQNELPHNLATSFTVYIEPQRIR